MLFAILWLWIQTIFPNEKRPNTILQKQQKQKAIKRQKRKSRKQSNAMSLSQRFWSPGEETTSNWRQAYKLNNREQLIQCLVVPSVSSSLSNKFALSAFGKNVAKMSPKYDIRLENSSPPEQCEQRHCSITIKSF